MRRRAVMAVGFPDVVGRKKLKTFKKGRVCEYPGCITVLSIYNCDPVCQAHYQKWQRGLELKQKAQAAAYYERKAAEKKERNAKHKAEKLALEAAREKRTHSGRVPKRVRSVGSRGRSNLRVQARTD